MMSDPSPIAHPAQPEPAPVSGLQLASFLASRLCHDFISPAGAIASGLDLLEDPAAQDMREEALGLIAASARKLVAQLSFDRVAFGGSAAAESFDARDLETLIRNVYAHGRSVLDWAVEPESLAKPAARVTLNLAQAGAGALPVGGTVKISARQTTEGLLLSALATGAKARLRPEVLDGLAGAPLGDGLAGHWVQAFFLRGLAEAEGGSLAVDVGDGQVSLRVRLP